MDIFIMSVIGCTLTIINQTLIRKKHWYGWVGVCVNVLPFIYVNYSTGAYGYLPLAPYYLWNAIMGIRQWRPAEKGGHPARVDERDPHLSPLKGPRS